MSFSTTMNQKKMNTWLVHFFLINLLIVYLLSFHLVRDAFPLKLYEWSYGALHQASKLNVLFAISYIFITYLGYFSFLVLGALAGPFLMTFFRSTRFMIIITSILCVSMLMVFILIDSYVFSLYRFHLNQTVFEMLFSEYRHEIFYFSKTEWIVFYLGVFCIFIVQSALAALLWLTDFINWSKWFLPTVFVSMTFLIISFFSATLVNRDLLQISAVFPFYNTLDRLFFKMTKEEMSYFTQNHYYTSLSQESVQRLHYPINPVNCSTSARPLNIFVIVIDTWRFDALNEKITPHLAKLTVNNLQFHHHISGGNATKPGIFSLFYGLPVTYWSIMHEQKQSPELIHQLIKKHYQLGIFASANLAAPNFAETIFNAIPHINISTPGNASYQRDQEVTRRFVSFIKNRDQKRPIFSFIFFDAAHAYCEYRDTQGPFQPEVASCNHFLSPDDYQMQAVFNRYLNAVNFVDQQVELTLNSIKKANLWNDSIVIVTGDHGEEFNDNHLTYWGHASNFTKYQTQVPLIVHWPGRHHHDYQHTTTHYDIVPTLLRQALDCKTPYVDYANGGSLFDSNDRYPIIVGSNDGVGYLTLSTITTLPVLGELSVQDLNGQTQVSQSLDKQQLRDVMTKLTHFLRR